MMMGMGCLSVEGSKYMYFPKLKLGAGIVGATLAAGMLVATPAQSTIQPFASFKAINQNTNVTWTNVGGTGGTFKSAPSTLVSFSFADPHLSAITNIVASMTLVSAVSNSPATGTARNLREAGIGSGANGAGTVAGFSFTTTTAMTVDGHFFAAGSNLLTVTFNNAVLSGNSGTARFTDSTTAGGTITYSSDFLTFLSVVDKDFALSLTSVSGFSAASGKALNSFSALATGNFSSDPAPIPSFPVPETATWAMFICGFGLMGATLRRRRPEHSLV